MWQIGSIGMFPASIPDKIWICSSYLKRSGVFDHEQRDSRMSNIWTTNSMEHKLANQVAVFCGRDILRSALADMRYNLQTIRGCHVLAVYLSSASLPG